MAEPWQHRPAGRALLGALVLFAASLPLSIAVAQASLALAVLAWWQAGRPGTRPGLLVPAGLYAALSLVSAAASPAPWDGLRDLKQLLLLVLLLVAPAVAWARQWLAAAFLAGSAAAALWGTVAYLLSPGGLEHRSRGPYGHYLTFAGVQMMAVLVAAALLLARSDPARPRRWRRLAALPLGLGLVALEASYARSAWLGTAAGLLVLVALVRPRALLALVPLGLLLGLLSPPAIQQRARSIVSLEANRDRLEIWAAGGELLRAHPWLGTGPDQLARTYRQRFPSLTPRPHLHNNPLQIAAERGLPALAAWILLMLAAIQALLARAWPPGRSAWDAAALAAVLALLVAGIFEYNFGDSEVLMSLLLVLGLALGGPEAGPRPEHGPSADPGHEAPPPA